MGCDGEAGVAMAAGTNAFCLCAALCFGAALRLQLGGWELCFECR